MTHTGEEKEKHELISQAERKVECQEPQLGCSVGSGERAVSVEATGVLVNKGKSPASKPKPQ